MLGKIDASLGKVTCCLAWGPEFDAWDPHSGRRGMTLKLLRAVCVPPPQHSIEKWYF